VIGGVDGHVRAAVPAFASHVGCGAAVVAAGYEAVLRGSPDAGRRGHAAADDRMADLRGRRPQVVPGHVRAPVPAFASYVLRRCAGAGVAAVEEAGYDAVHAPVA
jgi:hypothetical protein